MEDQLKQLEKRQKALYKALTQVFKWCDVEEHGNWCDAEEHGNRAEYELTKLEKAFDDYIEPVEEEPGEDQEWKTCDCCGGAGHDSHYDPDDHTVKTVKCDACDGKGKYIDDMD